MKIKYKIIAILITFILIGCSINLENKSIDSIVTETNKYIEKTRTDKLLVEGISEGTIEYNGQIGGFENYNLFDNETKELVRIRHSESTDIIIDLIFYYNDNKLIYVKSKQGHWSNNKFQKEYEEEVYYHNGKVILANKDIVNPNELYNIGMRHLKKHNTNYKKKN